MPQGIAKSDDYIPYSYLRVKTTQDVPDQRSFLVLFDSGSASSWVAQRVPPPNTNPSIVEERKDDTMAGSFTSNKGLVLKGISLFEFNPSLTYKQLDCRIMQVPCRYDMVLGRDFLRIIQLFFDFQNHQLMINGRIVPMRSFPVNGATPTSGYYSFDSTYDDCFASDTLSSGYKSKVIKESVYEEDIDLDTIIMGQEHLTIQQRKELLNVLKDFPTLFDGKLRFFKPYEISLELNEDAVPHASRPYPVPRSHSQVYKKKLDELVKQDVLEPAHRSEWIAGSFIVPKSDTQARWVTDFRHLNSCLRRRVYPIPKIQDILSRRRGCKWVILLDLMQHFYTFVVQEQD